MSVQSLTHYSVAMHTFAHVYTHPEHRKIGSKLIFYVKKNRCHVACFHLHLPEHFTSPSICMASQVSTYVFFWCQPEYIKPYYRNMCAPSVPPRPPPFKLLRPSSDHPVNCMVTGWRGRSQWSDSWGSIWEETGLHAEPHQLSGSVLSAGGAHHPLLS